jgi:hypothetical protein
MLRDTYSAKLVALEVLRLTATETTLVYQIGQFLCQHLFDHLDSGIESFLGGASDAKVKRWVLEAVS